MQAETEQTVLERLRQVRGVTFEWREGKERHQSYPGKNREMGVIAQEVQAAFPDAVVENDEGILMVDYPALVAALIESVKELADRVEALESGSRDI
ncbi:MAG TPA: tail fiber domain-containing protein [Solirubrobacteraceae bacterium]|nr:tail fiber domain-containing protein [Solirubrobacteraceae bacterium]